MSLQDTESGKPLEQRRKTKQIRMGKVLKIGRAHV